MGQIIVSGMTAEDLLCLIEQTVGKSVQAAIQAAKNAEDQEKLLTVQQAMKTLGVSRTTLSTWNDDGFLLRKIIGGRIYYRYGDVLAAAKTPRKYGKK